MKITTWVMIGLVLIAEGIGAWHVFGRFERTPVTDASFLDYASVLLPAVLFTLALAIISPRPLRFMLLVFLTGFGAFLLFVIGLRGIDRSWAAELGKPGLFVVNLGLALAAPIPLLAVLTGFRRDGLRAAGVALVYGGFSSVTSCNTVLRSNCSNGSWSPSGAPGSGSWLGICSCGGSLTEMSRKRNRSRQDSRYGRLAAT